MLRGVFRAASAAPLLRTAAARGCWQQPPLCRRHQQRRFATILRGAGGRSDPWKILGVSRDASDAEVKKAYIKLAKEHHPDKTGGDDTKFKQVKEAFDLIKSGEAAKQDQQARPKEPDFDAASGMRYANTRGRWQHTYTSQRPPGFEEMAYTSSATTRDAYGNEETVYTYRDANGNSYTYVEKKSGGDQNWWHAYAEAQQEALRVEAERMKQRANEEAEFRKVFENWAAHKMQQTVDYQEYVRARDRAVFRYFVAWCWLFLALKILLVLFV